MTGWWQKQTLRFRLALWYAVGGIVLLTGFSVTLYVYVADRLARPLGQQLHADLAYVRQHLSVRDRDTVMWDGRVIRRRLPWGSDYPWFELWDEQENLVQQFWPFDTTPSRQRLSAPAYGRETVSVFDVTPDLRLRVLSVPFEIPGQEHPWMIRMMRIHVPAADALEELRWIIVIALPVVIALLVAVGYFLTRRWLMPLDHMATEAATISAANLDSRLPVVNPHNELGRLALVFNNTLDRLEASFEALDRFVTDASHELRTPLTTLRSVAEVGLRRSRTVEEYREIIGSMLEDAERLQNLIQRLLELATAEGGLPAVHRTSFDLAECVTTCASELGILADAKDQRIALSTIPCQVTSDEVLFRQALQNLVDNAIKYSPENATIRVDMRIRDRQIEVTVTDNGPGINAEDRAHLAERFFRPDRGSSRGGFGLGLSITKAYMHVLGGSLSSEPAKPQGSTFRLSLPID